MLVAASSQPDTRNPPQPQQQQPQQQPLMTQQLPAGSSFQLIQGPDGQFILQTNPLPPVDTDQQQQSSALDGVSGDDDLGEVGSPGLPPSSLVAVPKSSPRSISRPRQTADPNRTPLYEDETLPPGWHRKVSQRKSGASAGRYEVFIIGPTGKRFRSRNELKTFFEKTGETGLNPDDFDFSTFGRNNPKVICDFFPSWLLSIL